MDQPVQNPTPYQNEVKGLVNIYKQAVKNVPILKYSWVLIATICILSLSAFFKLNNSDVFFYALLVIVISFFGFLFSYLLKTKEKFIRFLLYILLSSIVLTLIVAVLSFGTYIVWEKPMFYNRWFPKLPNSRQSDNENESLDQINEINGQSQKIINAFYFHERRFALAFKNGLYGFIDKQGNAVIPYEYKRAEQFDYTGYARVQKELSGSGTLENYLIDTSGNRYKVAYRIEDLGPDVEALDLRDQKLTSLSKVIFAHRQLKILLATGDYKRTKRKYTLPDGLFELDKLQTLCLVSFGIVELPPSIGKLTNLVSLWLNNNRPLHKVSPEIGQLTKLESLDLSVNDYLTTLPSEIGKLTNLRNLYLSFNTNLSRLPSEIWQLTNLKDLNVHGTRLTTLPSDIGRLANLRILFLSANPQLEVLPSEVWNLSNLQCLILGGTDLSQSPPKLNQLKNLTELNLERTNLTEVPEEIGDLTNLTNLYLAGNKELKSLPKSVWKLTKLTDLILGGTSLTSLPPDIGNLSNLTTLYLDNTGISSLPEEIEKLTSLSTLELENTKLSSLPKGIVKLKNLRVLYLQGNRGITSLPVGMEGLSSLKELHLNGTSITSQEIQNLKKLLPSCEVYH